MVGNCGDISIARFDPDKGEEKAQSRENARFRQPVRKERYFSDTLRSTR
jgi:hypothetical protein